MSIVADGKGEDDNNGGAIARHLPSFLLSFLFSSVLLLQVDNIECVIHKTNDNSNDDAAKNALSREDMTAN